MSKSRSTQDGRLMSQGNEIEFQREGEGERERERERERRRRTRNESREARAERDVIVLQRFGILSRYEIMESDKRGWVRGTSFRRNHLPSRMADHRHSQ